MGRAKLRMELISKEKSRNITFKKRKEGLVRKLQEFTTLCDVSACMVIYGPTQEKGAVDPEIWPQNIGEINRIMGIYKAKNKDSGNKTYCLSDFFHDRKRKIEEELAKLRKKNMESKYPTWLDLLNFMTEAQLREFSASLTNKAKYVKSRIELLRRNQQGFGFVGMELGVINHEQQHPQDLHSMMMLLMNEQPQVFYESMFSGCGVVDPIMYHTPQYYMPLNIMPVQLSIRDNHYDIVQYQMENHKANY